MLIRDVMRHKRSIAFSVFILLTIAAAGYATYAEWTGLKHIHLLRYDYGFFYYAFGVMLNHQPASQLYNMPAQESFFAHWHFPVISNNQYVYPPQFAMVWELCGRLPFLISADLWMAMSAILYGASIFALARMFWPRLTKKWLILLLALAILFTPAQIDVGVGNVNCVLFTGFVLTFSLLYRHQKAWLAGIPLGLVIVFKVTPIAVLVYLFLRKKWKTGISAVCTVVVSTLFAALWIGTRPLFHYVHQFLGFGHTSMQNGPAPYNQSLLGVLGIFSRHHWIHVTPSLQQTIFLISIVVIGVSVLYITQRTRANWRIDVALASLTPLLFSPLIEQMHMIFAIPAFFAVGSFATDKFRRRGDGLSKSAIALSVVLVLCFVTLSLPMTFLLNDIAHQCPSMFWVQTQMFWVLMVLFVTLVWQSIRIHQMRFRNPAIVNISDVRRVQSKPFNEVSGNE